MTLHNSPTANVVMTATWMPSIPLVDSTHIMTTSKIAIVALITGTSLMLDPGWNSRSTTNAATMFIIVINWQLQVDVKVM